MNKYLLFILTLICLYTTPKAQLQVFQAQDLQIKNYHEFSGHIFVIANIHGDDSCTYFLLNSVNNDFYLISGACRGDETMSRYISDEDLGILMELDAADRHNQQNPKKPDNKSKEPTK